MTISKNYQMNRDCHVSRPLVKTTHLPTFSSPHCRCSTRYLLLPVLQHHLMILTEAIFSTATIMAMNLTDLIKYLLTTQTRLLDNPTGTHTRTTQTLCKQLEGHAGWLLAPAYSLESRLRAHTLTSRGTRILLVHSRSKVMKLFFQKEKIWYLLFVYRLWKIISINTKCFAIYIPDLIKFRNCVTAQWLPKVGHVRKTRCKTETHVSHTKEIPVSATTH